jgi:hypothetical protein
MRPVVFLIAMFLFAAEQAQGLQVANAQERPENTAAKTEPHKSVWRPDDPVSLYTLVLSVFTGFLVVVTGGLIWVGSRQVSLTKEIADRQSRDTEILQRAYIAVEPGGMVPHRDRGDRVICRVIFRNVGHLPARNVRWYGSVKPTGRMAIEGEPDEPEVTGFPIGELPAGSIVLPPGTETTMNVATLFTYRLQNTAFIWGIVTYDDGFGNTRFTKFCHWYDTKLLIGAGSFTIPADKGFLNEEGNDAD